MEKDLNYWKKNAEEDYMKVPISVLRYITELEKAVLPQADVSGSLPHYESPIELIERRFVTADGVIVWDEEFKRLLTNLLGGNDC